MKCAYCQQKEREREREEERERERAREVERQQRCHAAQQHADAICQTGPGGDVGGRFGGGETLSHGLTCLASQSIADAACKK